MHDTSFSYLFDKETRMPPKAAAVAADQGPPDLARLKEYEPHQAMPMTPIVDMATFEKRADTLCTSFDKGPYVHLVQHFLSVRSPHRNMMLYHGLGVGKTCTAITLAETLLKPFRKTTEATTHHASVWVVAPKALQKSFQHQLFELTEAMDVSQAPWLQQCTQDTYLHLLLNDADTKTPLKQRVWALVQKRYTFYTYEGFAQWVESVTPEACAHALRDTCLIVDEAHNLRSDGTEAIEDATHGKRIAKAFVKALQNVQDHRPNDSDHRLVLLTATPMFNDVQEILFLLSLLSLSDGGKGGLTPNRIPEFVNAQGQLHAPTLALVERLAERYVSYVRSENPLTFGARLSPAASGTPMLQLGPSRTWNGEEVPDADRNWVQSFRDGILASPLGNAQQAALTALRGRAPANTAAMTTAEIAAKRAKGKTAFRRELQMQNAVYPTVQGKVGAAKRAYRTGKEGFGTLFEAVDAKKPLQVAYRPNGVQDAFGSGPGQLTNHAGKIAKIVAAAAKSEGIVVVYSQYVWSGVVPVALALEHVGFQRYDDRNLLARPHINAEHAVSGHPKYIFLADDADIRSRRSIDALLAVLNHPNNKRGDTIKVVLMTPVASEGLSFQNVREMHILEPWFHMNVIEQVVGRAIRRCSHRALPVQERNVTVYLHATTHDDGAEETADLHAYHLAADKETRMVVVRRALQTHALDCTLMRPLQRLPKRLFPFHVFLRTSQGHRVPFQFGDDALLDGQDVCAAHVQGTPIDARSWRREVYEDVVPTLRARLIKALQRRVAEDPKATFHALSYAEALGTMQSPSPDATRLALLSALTPATLWSSWTLVPHRRGLLLKSSSHAPPQPMRRAIGAPSGGPVAVPSGDAWKTLLDNDDPQAPTHVRLWQSYMGLDSSLWPAVAHMAVAMPDAWKQHPRSVAWTQLMTDAGAFVSANQAVIGYVDLFAAETAFEVWLWDAASGEFKEASGKEAKAIAQGRRADPFPNPQHVTYTMGMFQRMKSRAEIKKQGNAPYRMVFKLMRKNAKSKGIVCETLKRHDLQASHVELGGDGADLPPTLFSACQSLAWSFMQRKRFWMPPIYKPSS